MITVLGLMQPGRPTDQAHRRPTVALVGADGAGKSTVTRLLEETPLGFPVKRIYMGVNLEASTLMLPTTRLLLAVKRRRGRRPDLVGSPRGGRSTPGASDASVAARPVHDTARLIVWVLEEWLRQGVAAVYRRRGYLVVFDRHFYADYYHSDVAPGTSGTRGLHGWMLEHVYPKPDLVICLDAPAEVLFARKSEAPQEWLENRRQQYLALSETVPGFVVVDGSRPLEEVFSDVLHNIRSRTEKVPA